MGILESIWEFIQPYLSTANLMTALAYVVGLVVAKTGLDFVAEIKDVIETYRDAKKPASPGGTDVTDKEENRIRAQAVEAIEAVWEEYKGTIFGLLGRLYNRVAFWK